MSTTTLGSAWDEFEKNPGGDFGKTLLDPATYNLTVKDARAVCKTVGKEFIGLDLEVADGPYAGAVTGTLHSFSEKARGIFFQNLVGFGLDKAFWTSVAHLPIAQALEAAAAALKGRTITGILEHNDYNGKISNQFKVGAITLVAAPPLPAIGGIPQVGVAPVAAAPPVAPPVAAPVIAAAPAVAPPVIAAAPAVAAPPAVVAAPAVAAPVAVAPPAVAAPAPAVVPAPAPVAAPAPAAVPTPVAAPPAMPAPVAVAPVAVAPAVVAAPALAAVAAPAAAPDPGF